MDAAKLAKLQAAASRLGGKGTPRKVVKKPFKSVAVDEKKLESTLKNLNAQVVPETIEANMFRPDGSILHVAYPKVQANVNSDFMVIYGTGEEMKIQDLVPDILPQMGVEAMTNLRKMAELYQKQAADNNKQKSTTAAPPVDEDIPDLVEDFE